MNDSTTKEMFQAQGRKRGTIEWQPILHSGQCFYADNEGLPQLHQMTSMMAQVFRMNEYKIEKVTL